MAMRNAKPLAYSLLWKSASNSASPPHRWATPLMSMNRPSGPSAATAGEIAIIRGKGVAAGLDPRIARGGHIELVGGDDGVDTTAWADKAANTEKDQTYKWYNDELGKSQEQWVKEIEEIIN